MSHETSSLSTVEALRDEVGILGSKLSEVAKFRNSSGQVRAG
jgi:hypothetical protein